MKRAIREFALWLMKQAASFWIWTVMDTNDMKIKLNHTYIVRSGLRLFYLNVEDMRHAGRQYAAEDSSKEKT